MPLPYPPPPRADVVENLHGEAVADPFRPLEDPGAAATVAWIEAENELTEQVLAGFAGREDIRRRVSELWDYPKLGVPFERGGQWFQMRNSGLQAQSVLFVADRPDGEGRLLIDPNTMSDDGTVSLTGLEISRDGELAAYATSTAGSDWMTWRVRRVGTGRDLDDVVEWSKFSGAAWTADSRGFYYTGVERPPTGEELTAETGAVKVAYHRLGTPQSDDRVEFAAPDHPDWIPSAAVTDDGRHLVVTIQRGTGTETSILVRDLTDRDSGLEQLNEPFAVRDEVVEADGDGFVVHTERDAERGRLVRAHLGVPPAEWAEVVPEGADTLVGAALCGGRLVCHFLRHAHSVLRIYERNGGTIREIPLPGLVSLGGVEGRPRQPLLHFSVVSYLESGSIWAHDLATDETRLVAPSAAPFDPSGYLTEQVFVPSDDGTEIPVFLTRRKDARPDGSARVILYGYGGFAVPVLPAFSVGFSAWLERGGMVAVANLRGGGEYGRAWHDAGRLALKQNVFDDFAACARWLSASGWSRPERIAIMGGSNGGLLVGASLSQHPELFGAALPEVGVLDMLRFHRFTIGWAWKSDYGDPEDPEQFAWLRAYSPLHNLAAGRCYPATLVMTGDHDDRVVPAHSFKFAAALQEAQSCDRPVLLRVSVSAGHGAGKPTAKLIDEATDRLSFLEMVLPA